MMQNKNAIQGKQYQEDNTLNVKSKKEFPFYIMPTRQEKVEISQFHHCLQPMRDVKGGYTSHYSQYNVLTNPITDKT